MRSTRGSADTIVAISSALGRGALSIVRLSGPDTGGIGQRLLSPYPEQARYATLATARDPESGVLLDQLIAVRYDAPASYTGEQMLELSCHGGQATSRALLACCLALGARSARPGEFTQRALLNGKLDLAQAEALPDLIDAASEPMRRIALGTVGGGLSRHVAELRDSILQLEAVMAYSVDFPEEDDGEVPRERFLIIARDVVYRIRVLLETAKGGSLIREGALVVFAGPPNVGKSSLFNAVLGQERAIVTEIPGTTRDAIEHPCMIGPWPVRLVDTAGMHSSHDLVERLGIEVSERYLKDADVSVVCSDGSVPSLDEMVRTIQSMTSASIVCVQTKLDLRQNEHRGDDVWVSAKTGVGLHELKESISAALDQRYSQLDLEKPVVTQVRHAAMLEQAAGELAQFVELMENSMTPAIAIVHLHAAVAALEEIIGAVSVDDLLDQIFSRFCVGK